MQEIGFYPVTCATSLLEEVLSYSEASALLGSMIETTIVVITVISVVLIYQTLAMTLKYKSYELGIMRLLGLTSIGYTCTLYFQVLLLAALACLIAYPLACFTIYKLKDNEYLHEFADA